MSKPLILVHGGAGDIPESRVQGKLDGVCRAVREAFKKYEETENILDATQAAVEYMETDKNFNAGYGSVLTEDGEIELEALVIEGKNLRAGAVTGLRNVLHPIVVARLVMENTPHVLLSGEGVQDFARKHNIPIETSLHTKEAWEALECYKKSKVEPSKMEIGSGGTVGAVGIDVNGHMVSCTSTGGITGKMKGRVGDTPIPGSGGYADDNIGAVSTTGYGDAILRFNVAHRILSAIEYGSDPQKASESVFKNMQKRIGKSAGAISIAKDRSIGIAFTSKRMAWAYQKDDKIYYGINPGECLLDDE